MNREGKQSLIGAPVPRIDGRLKVTGAAEYADDLPLDNPAQGVLATSPIARGRVVSMDLAAARAVPGVLAVYTCENVAGRLKPLKSQGSGGFGMSDFFPLRSNDIVHHGQIVALVVAETDKIAHEGVRRLDIQYETAPSAATFDSPGAETRPLGELRPGTQPQRKGDADAALKSAAFAVSAEYETSPQVHAAIELYSSAAYWQGDNLIVHEPSQWLGNKLYGAAEQFGLDPSHVMVRSPFVGGGFGGKGSITPRLSLAAFASKELKRPVRIVVPRNQCFTTHGHRAETRHRLTLAASADGRLLVYRHHSWEATSRSDVTSMSGTDNSVRMYACANVDTALNLTRVDRVNPAAMRAPPEVPFLFPLESAMDELAHKAGIDPLEFRLRNDTDRDPMSDRGFSSRSLAQCLRQGAERFGWSRRTPSPRSMRDGDWLIGWGCASTMYPTYYAPAVARVRIDAEGARVQAATHEIGTGVQTVLAQIAGERLGIPADRVLVETGDSRLPPTPYSGGSMTTAVVGSAIVQACDAIRRRLGGAVGGGEDARTLLARAGLGSVEELAEWSPPGAGADAVQALYKGRVNGNGGAYKEGSMAFAFGAHFVEVRVHVNTREIRVPRSVSAFAAGRIINERTARSQLMGGVIWGLSSALRERAELDLRASRYVNDNLGEYLIPVNADIGSVDILLVPEVDATIPGLGVKGIGELGNPGADAAVANAVFHATGVRVRRLPIRIEDLFTAEERGA